MTPLVRLEASTLGCMRPKRAGLAHVAALMSCVGLVAACASGAAHHAQARPSVTPAVTPSAKSPSPVPKKVSAPDALGAKRVIPVPKSCRQPAAAPAAGRGRSGHAARRRPGSEPRPLLLVLHGMGEDAVEMRQQTGFTALAAL